MELEEVVVKSSQCKAMCMRERERKKNGGVQIHLQDHHGDTVCIHTEMHARLKLT